MEIFDISKLFPDPKQYHLYLYHENTKIKHHLNNLMAIYDLYHYGISNQSIKIQNGNNHNQMEVIIDDIDINVTKEDITEAKNSIIDIKKKMLENKTLIDYLDTHDDTLPWMNSLFK
jgi:hypothetical protein